MKKLTKILSVIAIVAILVVSLSVFVSCTKAPAEEDATFSLVIRKASGEYSDPNYLALPAITGDVIVETKIAIKAGQTTIADAFAAVDADPAEDVLKVVLNDTDYLVFTSSQYGWALTDAHFASEPSYTASDIFNSYMARNGAMSNGITNDSVVDLESYTIVIDGWDGHIGS